MRVERWKWLGAIVLLMIGVGALTVFVLDQGASRRLSELRDKAHEHELAALAGSAAVLDEIEESFARVFLGVGQINKVLVQFDGTDIVLKDTELQLHVKSVRAEFAPGYPKLKIEAYAYEPGLKVKVSVEANAALYFKPSEDGLSIEIQPVIFDLEPTATFGPLRWNGGGVIKKLALLRANDEIARLGAVQMPTVVDLTQTIARPAFSLDVPIGRKTAFTLDATAGNDWVVPLTLHARAPLVMSNGILFSAEIL